MAKTASDFLNQEEVVECHALGINPRRVVVTVMPGGRAHGNDFAPTAMPSYDEVEMVIPREYKMLTATHQVCVTGYGYAAKIIKEELLGYW